MIHMRVWPVSALRRRTHTCRTSTGLPGSTRTVTAPRLTSIRRFLWNVFDSGSLLRAHVCVVACHCYDWSLLSSPPETTRFLLPRSSFLSHSVLAVKFVSTSHGKTTICAARGKQRRPKQKCARDAIGLTDKFGNGSGEPRGRERAARDSISQAF